MTKSDEGERVFTCLLIPDHSGFALVGNTDASKIRGLTREVRVEIGTATGGNI